MFVEGYLLSHLTWEKNLFLEDSPPIKHNFKNHFDNHFSMQWHLVILYNIKKAYHKIFYT